MISINSLTVLLPFESFYPPLFYFILLNFSIYFFIFNNFHSSQFFPNIFFFNDFLVVLLATLYQLHKSTMHYLNEKMDVDYSGSKVVAVGRNSKCEILNVVLGFFTVYFLIFKEPYGSFTSWAYKISFVVALCCVGLFLQSKNIDHKKERNYIENSDNNRNFPVAVIFHAVVTICYMFMNVGMHQCKLNLKMVENLRKDLTMKKNKKTK